MSETKTFNRVGIVASIVGAVGAIVYLLRKPSPEQVATVMQVAGAPGVPGAPGSPGLAGPQGVPGKPGDPSPAPTAAPPSTVAGVTPSGQSITEYFLSSFYPAPGDTPGPTTISYNAPPRADLGKQYMGASIPQIGTPQGSGGCGCGGGKKSGGCPNTQAPLQFPDGQGSCASTTPGRMIDSMFSCSPGLAQQYFGLATDNMLPAIVSGLSRSAHDFDYADFPPPPGLRLGAN